MTVSRAAIDPMKSLGVSVGELKPLESHAAAHPGDSPEKIDKAAEDFEGLLLQQMFDVMWSTVPNGGLLDGGNEAEYYRDMLNQELAKEIAHSQSIGLKKAFADDMKRIEGIASPSQRKLGVG